MLNCLVPAGTAVVSGAGRFKSVFTGSVKRMKCMLVLPILNAEVRIRLLGAHQLDNAAAAVAAAACLRRHGMRGIDMAAVAAGLAAAQLPGRFQLCQFSEDAEEAAEAAARAAQGASSSGAEVGPWVVLDGAHTPESAAALAHTLRELFPTAPVALVMAMAEDKQHRWAASACILPVIC